ncbi:hypothetical protein FHR81_003040 [Actinoalloteichus hoggarensis]|uniref:hypothetical protein n=1 Tax=Actinoalloteichus hoggarensis TaxID=1470176 RepID=UPI0012FDDC0C|nr:hypothetical protein [Actinoalloteichus hoggarensis]MBB5922000.1 hypothetical protein [Actinoalloteichus hoggarensis]
MNNIDYEIANPDPVSPIVSLSSSDVPAELNADLNVKVREQTVVPPIPVRGHLRRIGVAACQRSLQHRVRTTARIRGADFLFVWSVPRDNRQLTCSDEAGAPAPATGARGGVDSDALGAEA